MDTYNQLLLKKQLGSKEAVISEIINLKAIIHLPKGTEHFVSDVHGEFDALQHVLKNGSGSIKEKIHQTFHHELNEEEQKELASLIYYPKEKLQYLHSKGMTQQELQHFYQTRLLQLIALARNTSKKYTRSKVRKSLPTHFAYMLEELLYETESEKKEYYHEIIQECIRLGQAEQLIIQLSELIQRFVVDHLHVVGDIFDRGPAPDKIIDLLMQHHSVDIQWGNHDIIWIGAISGSALCMVNVLRICARYDNLDIIEDAYGINIRPLFTFAEKYYNENAAFYPKIAEDSLHTQEENIQLSKVQQALTILQLKLETALLKRRPEFQMASRCLLEKINRKKMTINIDGHSYLLQNECFQTVDWTNPARLLPEEMQLLEKLQQSFSRSQKLAQHIHFLMEKGSLYLIYNDNLLIHGCIPLNPDGSFEEISLDNKTYKGKELLDFFEYHVRKAYHEPQETNDFSTDLFWYLWSGECSSLFGKKAMTTFERYFIADTAAHYEAKNAYYHLRDDEKICRRILEEFGISSDDGHIINGHTPVIEIKGEDPIKANGKMIVIDGGYSKPYQKKTGIAGYTLLFNSYGMQLAAHQPFTSIEDAVQNGTDILSMRRIVDRPLTRKKVKDTTIGKQLQQEIHVLEELLHFYE